MSGRLPLMLAPGPASDTEVTLSAHITQPLECFVYAIPCQGPSQCSGNMVVSDQIY